MATKFVRVLIPATGRVELVHPQTAKAHGLTVVHDLEQVAADLGVDIDDPQDDPEAGDGDGATETVAPQPFSE